MSQLDRIILRLYGRSFGAFGLLTAPILLLTLTVVALAVAFPGKEIFWSGAWCVAVIVQVIGVYWSRQIRLKHQNVDS